MKHKHYDMIVAKAANMNLVVFQTDSELSEWHILDRFPMWGDSTNYFLCLPQHKEACLHWLNGGDVQLDHFDQPMLNSGINGNCHVVDFDEDVSSFPWKQSHPFMDSSHELRIKAKKEKRWIAYMDGNVIAIEPVRIDTERRVIAKGFDVADAQYIEIEVEV